MNSVRDPRGTKSIKTQKDLMMELGISDLDDIGKKKKVRKEIAKRANRISPALMEKLIDQYPQLTTSITAIISEVTDLGKSMQETKRKRWEALQDAAKRGKMSGDQIVEAIRLIQEIEKDENKTVWGPAVAVATAGILAGLAALAILVLGSSKEDVRS